MALKPWYKVVTPREDLREGRPLDASEFAVHLDAIREGKAPVDYQKPERFFEMKEIRVRLAILTFEFCKIGNNSLSLINCEFYRGSTSIIFRNQ